MKTNSIVLLAAAVFLVLPLPVRAAEPEAAPEAAPGIPAYSVARLKINEGTVWVREGDTGEWKEYTTNSPVAEKSRVNVPENSDAELEFHGQQGVLLTGGTEIVVREMNRDGASFQLKSGEIRFDLGPDDFAPVKVAVPGKGKVGMDVPGRYWLDVRDDGSTRLVVRKGEGAVTVAKGRFAVKEGEQATIGDDVRVAKYSGAPEKAAAPRPLSQEEQAAGVPPATAYELRDYGDWVETPDYGYAWRPRVAVGWSPYYYGRWVWIDPWGWTWASYEPWGWWPYHIGWWFDDPFFGWVWCPYRSFSSFSFRFGFVSTRFFFRDSFFCPSTVRFFNDGRRVRWVPLRPGDRIATRAPFARTDTRLVRWDRQLGRGAVFARQDGSRGTQWRDWTAVQRERTTVMPRGIDARARGDFAGRGGRGGDRIGRPEARGLGRGGDASRRPETRGRGRGDVVGRPGGRVERGDVPGRPGMRGGVPGEIPVRPEGRRFESRPPSSFEPGPSGSRSFGDRGVPAGRENMGPLPGRGEFQGRGDFRGGGEVRGFGGGGRGDFDGFGRGGGGRR